MIRFRCPHCDSQMEVDESFAGQPARCPTCGTTLKVPAEDTSHARAAPAGGSRRGTARVMIGGEDVDVVPPLDTMVIVSLVCVGLAVGVFLLAGLTKFVRLPWAVGALLGMLMALLGVIVAIPAYHSIRRSKGRRRGRTHAMIALGSGSGLFLIFAVVALVLFLRHFYMRATCEENLEHIYVALRQYADDHKGAFPPALETLADEGYLPSDRWLTCPAHVKASIGENTYVLTPEINVEAKRPGGEPWWPPDTMIVSDGRPDAHQDGKVRVLLLNGEIKHIPLSEWYAYRKTQNQRWSRIVMERREARPRKPGPPPERPKTPPPASGDPSAAGTSKETGP